MVKLRALQCCTVMHQQWLYPHRKNYVTVDNILEIKKFKFCSHFALFKFTCTMCFEIRITMIFVLVVFICFVKDAKWVQVLMDLFFTQRLGKKWNTVSGKIPQQLHGSSCLSILNICSSTNSGWSMLRNKRKHGRYVLLILVMQLLFSLGYGWGCAYGIALFWSLSRIYYSLNTRNWPLCRNKTNLQHVQRWMSICTYFNMNWVDTFRNTHTHA